MAPHEENVVKKSVVSCVLAVVLSLSPPVAVSAAETPAKPVSHNWPGWRGDGSGVSDETQLPLHWDEVNNIAWRIPLPGEGNSSPIVWNDRVYLTAAVDSWKTRLVICVDANDGQVLWQREIEPGEQTKDVSQEWLCRPDAGHRRQTCVCLLRPARPRLPGHRGKHRLDTPARGSPIDVQRPLPRPSSIMTPSLSAAITVARVSLPPSMPPTERCAGGPCVRRVSISRPLC